MTNQYKTLSCTIKLWFHRNGRWSVCKNRGRNWKRGLRDRSQRNISGRPVAIKRIHRLLLEQARYQAADYDHVQQEFLRECEILSSLIHPHIVEFVGVFDVKGEKALVMELLHETLRDYLVKKKKQDGGLQEKEACRISSEIVDGLNYLHGLKPPVVHRDLNSKNVLLTETGLVKISDLGQAKFRPTDLGYLTTAAPGCIPYMPPEVLGEDPRYTEKMDTFSLGVLMLQMVTCLDPNPSLQGIGTESEIDRRRNHIKLVPESHPLRIVIISCLENDPEKRPSAESLSQKRLELSSREYVTTCVNRVTSCISGVNCCTYKWSNFLYQWYKLLYVQVE